MIVFMHILETDGWIRVSKMIAEKMGNIIDEGIYAL
jgi:hypothetical protein